MGKKPIGRPPGRPSKYTEEIADAICERMIEIYGLFDPKTGELRYIGKSNNSIKRLASHLRDAKRRKTPLYCWINKLLLSGREPVCKVFISVKEDVWRSAEIFAINTARSEGIRLLNVADGGDEPYCSREVRRQNGIKTSQTRDQEKTRIMMFLSQALRGGYVSEFTKGKMRRNPELMKTFSRYL